jgi:class 3 adenylate cyclase
MSGTTVTTVLVTDLVGSTELAARLGDRRWSDLVERHHTLVREQLARFGGSEVDGGRRLVPEAAPG